MRLHCGPTKAERKREAYRLRIERRVRLRNWHRKFAWLPVRMSDDQCDCRWLEFVYRRFPDANWKMVTYYSHSPGALRGFPCTKLVLVKGEPEYLPCPSAPEALKTGPGHRHRWTDDLSNPDCRFPGTYHQICGICGCDQEDGRGVYVGNYAPREKDAT